MERQGKIRVNLPVSCKTSPPYRLLPKSRQRDRERQNRDKDSSPPLGFSVSNFTEVTENEINKIYIRLIDRLIKEST